MRSASGISIFIISVKNKIIKNAVFFQMAFFKMAAMLTLLVYENRAK
jgi:hypothetical protein